MKMLLRLLAIVLGALVVLGGGLAAYLTWVFDPNDHRDRISELVRERTGRELSIAGEVGLSVFPWLGVRVGEVALANAAGFDERPFARAGRIELRARLKPLLSGVLEVDRVVLGGFELNLERDRDGRGNWEDLATGGQPRGGQDQPTDRGPDTSLLAALTVGGIEIEAARVSWEDRRANTRHEVRQLDLSTGAIRAGQPFAVKLGIEAASTAPVLTGRADLSGEVLVDPQLAGLTIRELALRLALHGKELPGGRLEAALDSDLTIDLKANRIEAPNWVLRGFGIVASGRFEGRDLAGQPRLSGTVAIAGFNPREAMNNAGFALPPTADPAVLARASLNAAFEAGVGSAAVRDIELRLDDSVLGGELALTDLAKGAMRFALKLDGIDLDRYLPPQVVETSKDAAPTAGVATIDASGLRALDLDGRFEAGRLKVRGLHLNDVRFVVRATGGVLRIAPIEATLYEGSARGGVTLDARGKALRVEIDEALEGVAVGPLLRDLSGREERLTGRARLSAKLQASGNDADAMKRSLGGALDFRFSDGALKGVNVAQLLREAQARLKGQPVPAASGPNQTDFSELSGSVQIDAGVMRNEDLRAQSPLLRVTGKGSADLASERIDYRIGASLVGTLEGQGGAELAELRRVTVPIRVGGTFAAPAYALDVEALLSDTVRERAREQVEGKLKEALGVRTGELPKDGAADDAKGESKADAKGDAKGDAKERLREGLRGLLR